MQGYGVYRFADKYGANVDGYSPIYTPDSWSESGGTYKLGTKGLIAWCVPLAIAPAQGRTVFCSSLVPCSSSELPSHVYIIACQCETRD
jgi:photosystem II protein